MSPAELAAGLPADTGRPDAALVAYGRADHPRWNRWLGGPGDDAGTGVATGDDGLVYLVGRTDSDSFVGRRGRGGIDVFVASFGRHGGRRGVSRFGGSGDDQASGVAVPRNLLQPAPKVVFVAGSTESPVVNGVVNHGRSDALIARLSE